ncbi:MAG: PxKF domain-containing protein [Thermoleophilia bacterium]
MSNHNYRAVLLAALAAVTLAAAALAGPPPASAATATFRIVDQGGDPSIPDVEDSAGIHYDVSEIVGAVPDTVEVAIPGATTTWALTAANAGTVSVSGYNGIAFSGIGTLYGGDGDDTFVVATASSGVRIDGGAGANTLDYSAYATAVTVNLGALTATATSGIGNIQNIIGGAGNDILTGDALDNVVTGGPGRDLIIGGSGVDTVVESRDANFTLTNTSLTIGAEGNDILTGIEAARLTGGPGNNTLTASTFGGQTVLDGGDGADTLRGGAGSDVLIGGAGDDAMVGGAGNDEFRGGPGANTITEVSTGGTDAVVEVCDGDFSLSETGLVWSEGSDNAGLGLGYIENVRLVGGHGDNRFDISAPAGGTIFVDGGVGFDVLTVDPHGAAVELNTDGYAVPAFGQVLSYISIEAVTVVAPVLHLPDDVTVEAASAAGAVVEFAATAEDTAGVPLAVTCEPASGSTFPLGTTTVNCTATDASGNTATGSFTVTVTPVVVPAIGWSGFLQPINADGSSVFRLGSTVPVKFALAGDSAGITDLAAGFFYAKVSDGIVGDSVEAISTSAATSGNLFRYDPESDQYIFNWGTKGLTRGTYQLRVDLGDGVEHTVLASLK